MIIKKRFSYFISFLIFLLIGIVLIFAAPYFHTSGTSSYLSEDQSPVFSYNFSANVTNPENDTLAYSIESINSSLYQNYSNPSFYYWIRINSSTGVITINSTNDNQTGRFNISIKVINTVPEGSISIFYFIANATNDYPFFTNIQSEYNMSFSQNFFKYINSSDEEKHYPLYFFINFSDNCAHANWSGRTNCTLFDFSRNISNNSVLMNFTPVKDDVGVYYANVSVRDYGEHYNCSSDYCASDYSQNKTTYYSQLITFYVNPYLDINISDCQNKIFQENLSNRCQIEITTKGANNIINISSYAILRNYQGSVFNRSWFFSNNITNSVNFTKSIIINVTPSIREVGNWSINFSVNDLTLKENLSLLIYIQVNRTYNDVPKLVNISFVNTSISFQTIINLTSYDDDFLIPDKNQSFGGFNETANFNYKILNRSDLSQELTINNFSLQILQMPVSGTNRTNGRIIFNADSNNIGDYTINITINDRNGAYDFKMFNLSIFNNNAPYWIEPFERNFVYQERNNTILNLSKNSTDPDNNPLTFSYANDSAFYSFNLNSQGIINFVSDDLDIGNHQVYVTISDGFLTNTTTLNFIIYNVNETPYIETPISAINASVGANSSVTCLEDNYTSLMLWVEDDDLKIVQKNFYNENLTINLNISGNNPSLFNFVKNPSFPTDQDPNRSLFEANFRPNKSDLGFYNISLIITDNSGLNTSLNFSLRVLELNHYPVLTNIINISTKINESLYYRLIALDVEDGNSSIPDNNNFTFNYSFVYGSDFIKRNETIFNSTTGELNITFNFSQGGKYSLNISVKDSTNKTSFGNFWIYVYDFPNISYPFLDYQFNLIENVSYNFTFIANHSVGDNLTYDFYFENPDGTKNLKYSLNYFGNNTNLTWYFTPNFSEAIFGVANLSLVVYPSSINLPNRTYLNSSSKWNLTINNSESPLLFINNILDINGTSPYQLILPSYFYDFDAADKHINQTIGFICNVFNFSENYTNQSLGYINFSIINWTNGTNPLIIFSAENHSVGNFSITAYEYDINNDSLSISNVTSNYFLVELSVSSNNTVPELTPSPTPRSNPSRGGGGAGKEMVPYAFKIIAPSYISEYNNKSIIIPFSLINQGKEVFKGINLSAITFKNGNLTNTIKTILSDYYVEELNPNENKSLILTMFFEKNISGDYEILLNASSSEPKYNDWAKIYINLQKSNESEDIGSLIIFTEELLAENPECLELNEILKEAKAYFEKGDLINARMKAEEAIDACKKSISQKNLSKLNQLKMPYKINEIFAIAVIVSIFLGLIYYFIKRRSLRKTENIESQFDNPEKRDNIGGMG